MELSNEEESCGLDQGRAGTMLTIRLQPPLLLLRAYIRYALRAARNGEQDRPIPWPPQIQGEWILLACNRMTLQRRAALRAVRCEVRWVRVEWRRRGGTRAQNAS